MKYIGKIGGVEQLCPPTVAGFIACCCLQLKDFILLYILSVKLYKSKWRICLKKILFLMQNCTLTLKFLKNLIWRDIFDYIKKNYFSPFYVIIIKNTNNNINALIISLRINGYLPCRYIILSYVKLIDLTELIKWDSLNVILSQIKLLTRNLTI